MILTRLPIRRQLLVLVAAIVLPVALLVAWDFVRDWQIAREMVHAEVRTVAHGAAARVAQTVEEHRTALERLAQRPLVQALDPRRCDPALKEFAALNPAFQSVAIRDRDGNSVCSPLGNPPPAADIAARPWFREGIASGRFHVSNGFRSRTTGRWVAVLSQPVMDDDRQVRGLVFVAVDLATLGERLARDLPSDALVGVYDAAQATLLRSRDAAAWLGKPRSADAAMAGEGTAGTTAVSDGSDRRYFADAAVGGTGWAVRAAVPEGKVFANARAQRDAGIAVLGGVTALMVFLVWFIGGAILRPVRELARVAERVAAGDGSARAEVAGPPEIASVARQFNEMLEANERGAAALRESEALWKLALEGPGDGVWDWDIASGRVTFSRRWKEMLGYAETDIGEGMDEWRRRVHPEDLSRVREGLNRLPERKSSDYRCEYRIRRRDGSWKWILDRGLVVARAPDGSPLRAVGTHTDISDRKHADAMLRARLRLAEIARQGQPDAFLDAALETAAELTSSEAAAFEAPGEDGSSAVAARRWSATSGPATPACPHLLQSGGAAGAALAGREVVMRNDGTHAPRELAIPILRGGAAAGVLAVGGKATDYGAQDVEALELIASLVQETLDRQHAAAELESSEARYRLVAERISDVIWILDAQSRRFRYVSPSIERLTGLSEASFLERSAGEAFSPASAAYLDEVLPERLGALARGEPTGFVERLELRRRDGSPVLTEAATRLLRDESTGRVEMYGVSREVTERRRSERDLRLTRERLAFALRNSHTGGWQIDLADGAVTCTPELFHMLGLEEAPADWGLEAAVRLAVPEDLARAEPVVRAAVAGQADWRVECRIRRPDGETRWLRIAGGHVPDSLGEARVVAGIVQDITEEVSTREALARGAEEFRALLAATTDGFWMVGADMRLLNVNDAYCQMTGFTRADLASMPVGQLAMLDRSGDIGRHLAGIAPGGFESFEAQQFCRDGRVIQVEVSATRIDGGRLIAFIRDISQRRRLEEARLRSQKLESLGTLAGGIAHDFNNILSAIRGNAELAAEDIGPDHPAQESLAEIRKAGARASELVRRITAFGRPKEQRREVTSLATVVEEVMMLLRSALPAGIALRKHFAADAPLVAADAAQVHEAVVNLTTNATHAIGPRAGTIDYTLAGVEIGEGEAQRLGVSRGRYALLTVADSGCGMEEGTKARIFDAFFTTKPLGEGTGLGLSMVYGIMQGHDGAVTVDSEPGRGSSFHLYFPAVEAERPLPVAPPKPAASKPAGRRVMYVDDEESLVSLATRALSRLGHEVTGFTDPRQALAAFRDRPGDFDVVVTDLSMPEMSGFQLAQGLLAARPGVPVVMTTGYIRAEDEVHARESGILELVPKPATIQELAVVLDALLRKAD